MKVSLENVVFMEDKANELITCSLQINRVIVSDKKCIYI